MTKHLLVVFSGFLISGCVSSQVNYNTLDVSRSYNSVFSKQVVTNILRAYEAPFAIPTLIKVSAASAGTTNSITPSFTLPLTPTVMGLSRTTSGAGLNLAASDLYTTTYTLSPVTDPDQLRRIRTLDQYVIGYLDAERFETNYPLIETSAASSGGAQTNLTITVDGKPVTVSNGAPDKKAKVVYVRRATILDRNGRERLTYILANPDTTFIKPPGCLLCDYNRSPSKKEILEIVDKNTLEKINSGVEVHKLEKNTGLRNDWLYRPDEPVGSDAIPIPSSGPEVLYAKANGLPYFYEFVLFNEEASLQGTGSPTSGGQSDGRKTSPLERISIPVAGGPSITP